MATWQTKQNKRASGAEVQITGEAYTIGADVANFVFLNEVPRVNVPSSVSVTQGATPFTEVTGAPAIGQFRVIYTGRLAGAIEFNATDNTKSITVSYWGCGSTIWARDINRLQSEKLDRDGTMPLTGPLKLPVGAVGLPSLTFDAETTLGIYRAAAATLAVAVGGTQILAVTAGGLNVLSGALQVGGVAVSLSTHTHAFSAISGSLNIAQINATGTRDANTYLRGDGTWAVIPTGGSGITQTFADGRYLQLAGGTLTGALVVSGQPVTADRYLTNSARLAIRAGTSEQSAIVSWNALQLIGARQTTVDYTPATEGGNLVAAGVIIPNQTASAMALYIRGASGQSGNLTVWATNTGTVLASLSPTGVFSAADVQVGGVSVSLSTHSHILSALGGTLSISQINASGTRDSTTYLRGDGTWAPIAGGGGGGLTYEDTDARYLQLTGGTVGGNLNVTGTLSVGGTAVSLAGHTHSAGDMTSGTLADARLSANVALLNVAQSFTALRSFVANTTTAGAIVVRTATDTQARFAVRTDGQLAWGAGGANAPDVTFARSSSATMTLDASLVVSGTLTVGGTAVSVAGHTHSAADLTSGTLVDGRLSSNVKLLNAAQTLTALTTHALTNATDTVIVVRTSADTQGRWALRADGHMSWGPGGTTSADTTMFRSAVATLTLSGSFVINGSLTVGGESVVTSSHTHAASAITSGTLSDDRLSANVARLNTAQTFTAAQTFTSVTSTNTVLTARVSVDTDPRFSIRADGQLGFGPGAGAVDVTLARTASNTVTLTGALVITSTLTVNGAAVSTAGHTHSGADITTGTLSDDRLSANIPRLAGSPVFTSVVTVEGAVGSDAAARFRVSGDTQPRLQIRADGQLAWGPGGSTAADAFITRTAGATLTLTGSLAITTGLTVNGVAVSVAGHTHAAGDITSGTLADGRLSTNVALLGTAQTYTTLRTLTRATSTDVALLVRVTADTQARWRVLANGTMEWGPGGSTAPDLSLARTAGATLTLTGSLAVSTALTVGGTAVSLVGHTHAFADLTGALALTQINATGTRDATTFLRGDGTWATVSGGGGGMSQAEADARYLQLTGGTVATLALTGNLSQIRGVAYTFPSSQGSSNTVLVNNGSGSLSWAAVPTHTHDASAINAGTLAEARLPTTVALLATEQTFTARKNFAMSSGNTVFAAMITGDTLPRLAITANGALNFGSGAASADVSITRSGSNAISIAAGTLTFTGSVNMVNSGQQFNVRDISLYGTMTGGAVSIGVTSGSINLGFNTGNINTLNLTGSATLTMFGGVSNGLYLVVVQPNGNSWSLNSSNVRWANGAAAPALSTSGVTVLSVLCRGSLYYVGVFGQNFPLS